MSVLKFLLLIGAGIGAVLGVRASKKGEGAGQIVAIGCAAFALLVVIASLAGSERYTPKIVKSMGSYGYAGGVVLGRHLAQTHAGSRVLILTEPVFDGEAPHDIQRAMVEGLEDGLGSAVEVVGIVAVDPPQAYVERARQSWARDGLDPPEGQTTNSIPSLMRDHQRWYDVRYFAELLAEHTGTYDLLISTVGLPRGFAGSALSRHASLPEFALMNAPGQPLKELIEIGAVDVAVAEKPTANPWEVLQNAPADVEEAFDKRYILVTKANLAEVAAAYPESPHWR